MEFRKERNNPGADILDRDGSRVPAVEALGMFADRKELALRDDEVPLDSWNWTFFAVSLLDLADILPVCEELMRHRIDAVRLACDGSDLLEEIGILLEPPALDSNLACYLVRREYDIRAVRQIHQVRNPQIDATGKARRIVKVEETIIVRDAERVNEVAARTEGSEQHSHQCKAAPPRMELLVQPRTKFEEHLPFFRPFPMKSITFLV